MNTFDDKILRDWLLHRLDAERARELEDFLIQDDDLAMRARNAEHDLHDDYAHDRLDAAERASVERTSNATDLAIARALARRHTVVPRRAFSAGWLGALAACALLVVGLGWRVWESSAVHVPTGATAQLTLLAENARGAGAVPVWHLPAASGFVRIQAEVVQPQPGARYRLSVGGGTAGRFSASNLLVHNTDAYSWIEATAPTSAFATREVTVTVAPQDGSAPATAWPVEIARDQ